MEAYLRSTGLLDRRWNRFEIGIKNAGIKKEEWRLVPYSLRYTFRSKYQGHIDLQAVMQMMGHRSIEMSDHYLQIYPEQFQVYQQYQEIIDRLWDWSKIRKLLGWRQEQMRDGYTHRALCGSAAGLIWVARFPSNWMGHHSEQMSEHYLRFDPDQFDVFKPYQDRIEKLWKKTQH